MQALSLLLFAAAALASVWAVDFPDEKLYPPAGLPPQFVRTCNFRNSSRSCRVFFNYIEDDINFEKRKQDIPRRERTRSTKPVLDYIKTGRGGNGMAKFGTKYLKPRKDIPRKAFCLSFRYRVRGNANLSLVEEPQGGSPNRFWVDNRQKNRWHFHTSQVSQDVPTKIYFEAHANGRFSFVGLADITLYNYTCTQRKGDTFLPYTGESKTLPGLLPGQHDAPLWPANATVPYEIQPGFSLEQIAMLERFFNDVQTTTCMRFTPRFREADYMNFIKVDPGSGCTADLGNVGQTKVMLDDQCFAEGYWQISHMAFHALAVRHEHVREDRDLHVQVMSHNAEVSKRAQFNKRPSYRPTAPYDLNSVMHFVKDEHSTYGLNTIQKIGDPNYVLGNRDGPTVNDYQKLADLYCNGVLKSETTRPPSQPRPVTTPRPNTRRCTQTTVIQRQQGTISHPSGSGIYSTDESCEYLVQAPHGKYITARFTFLDIQESMNCVKDSVTIYDGRTRNEPIITQLCGFDRPVENFTSTTHEMLVYFSSDSVGERYGFTLTYSVVDPFTPGADPAQDASLSPVDCNFDGGSTCAWVQDSSPLKFKRSNSITGISSDHSTSTSSGYYLGLDASTATAPNQYAVAKGSRIYWEDAFACFSFWYRMYDYYQDVGSLDVWYANNLGEYHHLWSHNSADKRSYSEWVQVQVNVWDIDAEFYRLALNATISQQFKTGDIAVDDVMLTQEDCPANPAPPTIPTQPPTQPPTQAPTLPPYTYTQSTPYPPYPPNQPNNGGSGSGPFIDGSNGISCDFETTYCNWQNSTTRADANWMRFSGRSSSGSSFGVQADHTKETPSGKYLLLNSIPNRKQTARLQVNVNPQDGYRCFEFYYMMYGEHLGRIRILAKYSGSNDEMLLFEARGNKPNKWGKAQASVQGITQAYTLIVEGYTTGQTNGDIGIDDFLLRTNDCYSEPLRELVEVTTPYTTPNYPFLCDFEDNNWCVDHLTMDPNGGHVNFQTWQGGQFNGPQRDHSTDKPTGRFAGVRATNYNQKAILTTETLADNSLNCMDFWYYMSPNSSSTIRVLLRDDWYERQLYVINSTNRIPIGQWINPQIKIDEKGLYGSFVIKFEVTMETSGGVVGFDDIQLSRSSKCQMLSRNLGGLLSLLDRGKRQTGEFSCRFGNAFSPFCGWQSNGVWKQVSTSADVDRSGADDRFAHVTSGRLMVSTGNSRTFPAPSAAMTSNITGVLITPAVTGRQACFRFFYKLSGWYRALPMDVLNVYVKPSTSVTSKRLIASLSASQTPPTDSLGDWVEQKMTVFEPQNYQIVLEATTGDAWIGSIAIDDVQMKQQICPWAFFW